MRCLRNDHNRLGAVTTRLTKETRSTQADYWLRFRKIACDSVLISSTSAVGWRATPVSIHRCVSRNSELSWHPHAHVTRCTDLGSEIEPLVRKHRQKQNNFVNRRIPAGIASRWEIARRPSNCFWRVALAQARLPSYCLTEPGSNLICHPRDPYQHSTCSRAGGSLTFAESAHCDRVSRSYMSVRFAMQSRSLTNST